LATLPADSDHEIREKISRAGRAQARWKATTFAQRRRVVRSLLRWLVDNKDMCARVACRDTGKTSLCPSFLEKAKLTWLIVIDAALGEVLTTCSKMEWIMKHGEKYLKPEKRLTNALLCYKSSTVYYEPLGVVAAVVSWNYRK
jgi:acyl-CoA reductase-like NAD-dependent aldehyde dehydrogenase